MTVVDKMPSGASFDVGDKMPAVDPITQMNCESNEVVLRPMPSLQVQLERHLDARGNLLFDERSMRR